MKPLIAKILIAICLFSFTPLKEFVKLPLLFLHYYNHTQESPDMTISEFFEVHYMHGIVFDDDYEQDMQLPFKSIDYISSHVFIFHDLRDISTFNKMTEYTEKDKINSYYRFCLQDANLKGIFHPPKFS
ncbi:MAG: hypothetical protein WBP08_16925 [Saprospiraceae bacterium]|jgi:hypothetical protein|nr:hypothetical protein [Saprospiraceae bacterium]